MSDGETNAPAAEPVVKWVTKEEARTEAPCQARICEDPVTGLVKITVGTCPPGYVDRMRRNISEKGLLFEEGRRP